MAKIKITAKVKKEPKRTLAKLEKIKSAFAGANRVRVGFPANSNNYPDGTSLIMVAAVHEFGSDKMNVPERSFLRSTVNENRREYIEFTKRLGRAILDGKMTMDKAMNILGSRLASDVQNKILEIDEPALKYREGNPLVDTGHMIQSVTYEISDK